MPVVTEDIVCGTGFIGALKKLTVQDLKRIRATIAQLINDPHHNSLKAHRINNAPGKWECYVTMDLRIIYELPSGAEPLRLWNVGHHKIVDGVRQLSFAETTRFVPVPGALLPESEADEMPEPAQMFAPDISWSVPAAEDGDEATEIAHSAPLAHYPAAHLRFLGVPAALVEQVQQAPSTDAILAITGLPEHAQTYLLDIFTNPNLEAVLFDPSRLLYRTTLDAIEGFCQGRIKQLMLNLTPMQERCVASQHEGVVVLRGVAGSGKTTVGLYRAIQRARAGRRVLLLTYNKTLLAALRSLVTELEGAIPANLTIHTVDSCLWQTAQAVLGQHLADAAMKNEPRQFMQAAIRATPGSGELAKRAGGHFLQEEINDFIMARGYQTFPEYRDAERVGRGTVLGKQQRALVWDVYKAYVAQLQKHHVNDYQLIASLVLRHTAPIPTEKTFDDIIIDETQDITLVKLRAVARLLRPTAEGKLPGAFWLLTDAAQTIYSRAVWWQEADLPAPPHRLYLRRNHRNTEQILTAAAQLLSFNKLREKDVSFIKPERATHVGPVPQIIACDTTAQQGDRLKEMIQNLCDGTEFRYSDVAVLCRTNGECKHVDAALTGIPVTNPGDAMDLLENSVKVLVIHSAKGLEFPVVFIFNATSGEMPNPLALRGLDGEEFAREMERERALFYVAMTRAADMLYIMTEPNCESGFLGELGDTVRWNGAGDECSVRRIG